MKIHKNSKYNFVAELTGQDMEYYCLDCASIDIENSKTRALISDLISSSRLEITASKPLPRLNIDVLCQSEKSILFSITLKQRHYYRVNSRSRDCGTLLVLIDGLDSLIRLYKELSLLTQKPRIKLYSCQTGFVMCIEKYALDKNSLKTLCLEFGECFEYDDMLKAYIDEHYRLLCSDVIRRQKP